MKQCIDMKAILSLFHTLSNHSIISFLNMNIRLMIHKEEMNKYKDNKPNHSSISPKKWKPINTSKRYDIESETNIPKKVKNTMIKKFIEIQKATQSDTSTLDSMRHKLQIIKSDINHTSHDIIKNISTPNRQSFTQQTITRNKKRDRNTRDSESISSDTENYNHFINRFAASNEPKYKPPPIPIKDNKSTSISRTQSRIITRDIIYEWNTSQLLHWIRSQQNNDSLCILFKYINNIENKSIDGRKLLNFT